MTSLISSRPTADPQPFSAQDVAARASQRLSLTLDEDALNPTTVPSWGDHVLSPDLFPADIELASRPAAVLVPIVAREGKATVLLTRRAAHLRNHAGQIAFPGGKIDETDASPVEAALREASEEIGLNARLITPLGYLDPWLTGTGFRVIPVVALVDNTLALTLNPDEVDDVFEVPVEFLMEPMNHLIHQRDHAGKARQFYAMPYGERYIWGATAGILRNLYVRLYG